LWRITCSIRAWRVWFEQVLSVRELIYVESARSVGARSLTIIYKHILPNIVGTLIVVQILDIPT
jgi:ABC-type dipeptide/oligopeptide/nickel transport system permease subunit